MVCGHRGLILVPLELRLGDMGISSTLRLKNIGDFPLSGFRIEAPDGALPHERDRKGHPLADDEYCLVRTLALDPVRSVVCLGETVSPRLVGYGIAGTD